MKCQLVSWILLTNFTEFSNSKMIIIPASQMSNPDSGHHTYSKQLVGNTLGCDSALHDSLKFIFSALTELGFSQVCPQMPSCVTPTAPHGCSSCICPCLSGWNWGADFSRRHLCHTEDCWQGWNPHSHHQSPKSVSLGCADFSQQTRSLLVKLRGPQSLVKLVKMSWVSQCAAWQWI